jgi:signal transduction histidine kinase
MLFMMLIYILAQFIHVKKPEYGYYSAYIFFVMCFAALRAIEILEVNEVLGLGKWFSYINDISQLLAYCMYFPFLRHYLNTKQNEPKLDRQLSVFSFALIVYIFVYWVFKWNDWKTIGWHSWNIMRVLLIAMVIYLATKVWKMKQPYAFYPIIGGLSFTFLALLAMAFTIYGEWILQFPYPFNYAVFYYFVGIIIELIFFSLGLGFKHRMDEVEKVEAQQALRLVADRQEFERYKSMTEARETERSRIAKDLHDGIGGLLSGVKISLANMQTRLGLKADDQLVFARSLDMLDGSVQELRRVAHAMMPPSLEVFGLKAALRDYVKSVDSMKTMKAVFQAVGEEHKLASENELIVYRIVQELMNNILKHAQATECLIQLAYLPDQLSITVEDDGNGFDSQLEKKGMGWINIRQRVKFLKGSLDLNTSEGNGTSVQINIPFA